VEGPSAPLIYKLEFISVSFTVNYQAI